MKLPLRRYAPGEFLIKQGERASDEVFLIKSGRVDIIVNDRETGEPVKVATREVGEFVGEIAAATALLDKSPSGKGKESEAEPMKSISEPDKEFLEGGRAKSTFAASISARIAGKKWVGQRRTADVVARDEGGVSGARKEGDAVGHHPRRGNQVRAREGHPPAAHADADDALEVDQAQGRRPGGQVGVRMSIA